MTDNNMEEQNPCKLETSLDLLIGMAWEMDIIGIFREIIEPSKEDQGSFLKKDGQLHDKALAARDVIDKLPRQGTIVFPDEQILDDVYIKNHTPYWDAIRQYYAHHLRLAPRQQVQENAMPTIPMGELLKNRFYQTYDPKTQDDETYEWAMIGKLLATDIFNNYEKKGRPRINSKLDEMRAHQIDRVAEYIWNLRWEIENYTHEKESSFPILAVFRNHGFALVSLNEAIELLDTIELPSDKLIISTVRNILKKPEFKYFKKVKMTAELAKFNIGSVQALCNSVSRGRKDMLKEDPSYTHPYHN